MKKLTARNSTFLHNAKLMFGAPAYKRILAAAQHSEGQAWNVAREYISLQGSEATRTVMFSERYATLDTMFDAIEREFIAANVSADAAPATEYVYRTTARPAWRGETVPNDGFIRSYSASHPVWSAADCVVYNRPLSLNEQARYELLPVSENAYVFGIGERVVYLENDDEYTISAHEDGRYHLTHELGDGVQFARAEQLAPAPDAAQTAAAGDDVDALVREWEAAHADPRDAQIAALERELEAVKQMFDGYQTAAHEAEQALTRGLEAARTEAAALRRFYDMAHNLDLTSDMYQLCWEQGGNVATEYIQMMEDLRQVGIVNVDPDAALASARQRADSGARTSADDVLAMFADDDAATLATGKDTIKTGDLVHVKYGVFNFTGIAEQYDEVEDEWWVNGTDCGWFAPKNITRENGAQS